MRGLFQNELDEDKEPGGGKPIMQTVYEYVAKALGGGSRGELSQTDYVLQFYDNVKSRCGVDSLKKTIGDCSIHSTECSKGTVKRLTRYGYVE